MAQAVALLSGLLDDHGRAARLHQQLGQFLPVAEGRWLVATRVLQRQVVVTDVEEPARIVHSLGQIGADGNTGQGNRRVITQLISKVGVDAVLLAFLNELDQGGNFLASLLKHGGVHAVQPFVLDGLVVG